MDNTPEIVGNQLFFAEVNTALGIKSLVVRLEGCGNVVTNVIPVYEPSKPPYLGITLLTGVFIFVAGDCKPVQPLPGTSNKG